MDTDITVQIVRYVVDGLTALSAIIAAASSMMNRGKLQEITLRVDKAVIVASETKKEAVETGQRALKAGEIVASKLEAKLEEVKDATLAVNAEVVQTVHAQGVEAGKEIAKNGNGHSNGRD